MRMMEKLLRNVGRSWAKDPKTVPVMEISKGTGTHTMMTVEGNQLHFHSSSFHPDMPLKQSIVLEDLTFQELADTVAGMGYSVSLTSEVGDYELSARKAFTLIPCRNVYILTPAHLLTFTSKLWKTLYPIARLLEESDNDTEKAIQQMFVTSTRGKWLDYWAGFFKIRRIHGENDSTLLRRTFMTLVNIKTNNIAIEELLSFSLQTKTYVEDIAPALFEVKIAPEYMAYKELSDELIYSVKGAGIDFLYHYYKLLEESYPSYLTDKLGIPAKESDKVSITLNGLIEAKFGWKTRSRIGESDGFDLNHDILNGENPLGLVYTLKDEADMTGEIRQSEEMKDASEESKIELSYTSSETKSKPTEYMNAEIAGFSEVKFGYSPNGFTLNGALFGKYRLKDSHTSELSSVQMEMYDKMQEEMFPLLVDCSFTEVFKDTLESYQMTVSSNLTEGVYRFSNSAFELGTSTLNGSVHLLEPRVKEGGSITLTTSGGTVLQSTTF